VSDFPWFEFAGLMTAFGISAIVPGLDFAVVLCQSVAHGRRAALFTSFGIASAILVHGAYTIFGLGLVISQSLLLFNLLKFAGAAYLLWLGIQALRAPAPKEVGVGAAQELSAHITAWGAWRLGFLTNLLNPKAVLFFVALFSSLVSIATAQSVKGFYVLSMSLMLFLWFALVSLFFTLPQVRAGFYRLGKWFNRASGAAFIFLAIRVAVSRQS
jgi:RhtB (resistance to homoserine/threonine) family protein